MKDPIERQEAIDAFDKQIWGCLNIPVCKEIRNAAKDTIRALPEIVRCKDCKHYIKDRGWNCIEYMVCSIPPIHRVLRKPNDFCSRAERRTDE